MKVEREKRRKTHAFLRYSDGNVNFTRVFNVFIRFKGRPGGLSKYTGRIYRNSSEKNHGFLGFWAAKTLIIGERGEHLCPKVGVPLEVCVENVNFTRRF